MTNEIQPRYEAGPLQGRWEPGALYPMARPQPAFDGSRLTQFLRRNYKVFLAVLVIVVALAVLLTLNQTKMYTTKATVMLDQRKQQVVQGLDEVVSNLPSADSSVVDTEVQVLSSNGMAYQVARALKLVPDTDVQKLPVDRQREVGDTILGITQHRGVQRVGLTYVIDIYYTDSNPSQAQRVANAFAQTYIASQVDVRVQANQRARQHLEQEIAKLQTQVQQADAAVARYKAVHNLTGQAAAGTLTEQEISSYNQALTGARAQAAEDSQRLASANSQLSRGSDSLGDASSPGLTQLRAQEGLISAHVAELAGRYGPNHPELETARKQLADVRQLIRSQSGRAVASLQSQAQASAGRVSAITGRLGATESELKRAETAGVELHQLETRLEAPQKLLEAYQARLAQISTQSGTEQPDARIVSLASYPLAPSSPNWIINIILGIGAGTVLGLLAVLARQIFSVGVGSGEDVELSFGVDFLGALPSLKDKDDIAIIDKVVNEPTSAFAESLRALATSVLFTNHAAPRVVAICSAFAEEGKTTTTIALGRVIAMRGRRTLVVDCDVQRPSFDGRFGIGSGRGLIDVLLGSCPLDQAIVQDARSPVHFLPLGRGLEPGKSLDESEMATLLDVLRERYDVVLLDLPPVLQVAETRVFAALADTTIVLARWKHTSKQAIDAALSTLMRAKASVIGVALTQVPASSEMMLRGYANPALTAPDEAARA